jgi:hypothetical protein
MGGYSSWATFDFDAFFRGPTKVQMFLKKIPKLNVTLLNNIHNISNHPRRHFFKSQTARDTHCLQPTLNIYKMRSKLIDLISHETPTQPIDHTRQILLISEHTKSTTS